MNGSLAVALGIGFVLGVKHATEADHLVAVTTIVSEQRSIWRASLVGALWGLGHTVSLLGAGVVVIMLELKIPETLAGILEFLVALMIIFLGGRILYLTLRYRGKMHLHTHSHDGRSHTHFHLHDEGSARPPSHPAADAHPAKHHGRRLSGWRPILVGMVTARPAQPS
jgi:ABC-type nickel/cobalt efflux system permease component RcnA